MKSQNALFNYLFVDDDGSFSGIKRPEEMMQEWFPVGSRFKIVGDDDWWHVVGYIDDVRKGKDGDIITRLIVTKSWNKYKQRYVYKAEPIQAFLYCFHLYETMNAKKGKNGEPHPFMKFVEELEKSMKDKK